MKHLLKKILLPLLGIPIFAYAVCDYPVLQYNNHYYGHITAQMTWDSAATYAMSEGGRLAVPNDSAENAWFVSQGWSEIWLGIHDPSMSTDYCEGAYWSCPTIASNYTAVDGAALAYQNWEEYEPNNLVLDGDRGSDGEPLVEPLGEHWVVMNQSGKWGDYGNHANTYHVPYKAEFVIEFEAPPACNGALESNTTDTTEPFCIADRNANGSADEGETFSCTPTTTGQICDADQVQCVAQYEEAVCYGGGVLNGDRDMCQIDVNASCPDGYTFDSSIDKCVIDVVCPDGGILNKLTDRCEKPITTSCDLPYVMDSVTDVCYYDIVCGDGDVYNPTLGRCERPINYICPIGYTYNASDRLCEVAPSCPAGSAYNPVADRCEEEALNTCPAGYVWNPSLSTCVSDAGCVSPSVLNPITDRCEIDANVVCPDGFAYDYTDRVCYKSPSCSGDGTYNPVIDACSAAIQEAQCPSGYSFNSSYGLCVESPICTNSSYNTSRDRCEIAATQTCPTGYILNSGICEAEPICVTGTAYDSMANRCEKSLDSCPAGYTWDTSVDSCVQSAVCESPATLNTTTDKCEFEATAECPTGSVFNSISSQCESSPICTSGGVYDAVLDKCTLVLEGTVCPTNYTYSATLAKCVENPICIGGTFNAATNMCETTPTYTCSDVSYSYNSTTARCEKAPVCTSGTYSNTYDKCLMDYTALCDTANGYTYNTIRSRCEKTPPSCISGTTYNTATNRCEDGNICNSGYTYNATSGKCEYQYAATITSSCFFGIMFPAAYNAGNDYIGYYEVSGQGPGTLAYYPLSTSGNSVSYISYNGFPVTFSKFTAPTYTKPSSGLYTTLAVDQSCKPLTITPPSSLKTNILGTFLPNQAPSMATLVTFTYVNLNKNVIAYILNDDATCPSGGTLSGTTCTIQQDILCPNGTTPDAASGKCVATATCPVSSGYTASFDGTYDVCYTAYQTSCPSGMTYDGVTNMCTASAVCSNGLLDNAVDKCYQSATSNCPSGYTLNGGVCQIVPTCDTGGLFDSTIDKCAASATYLCGSGYTYDLTLGKCTALSSCVTGTSLNTSTDLCTASASYSCSTGFTVSGTTCVASPSCTTPGVYSTTLDKCNAGSNVCFSVSGLTLDTTTDTCYIAPSCSDGGTLNTTTDKCQLSYTNSCPVGFVYDSTSNVCQAASSCDIGGSLETTLDLCAAQATFVCQVGYVYNTALGVCVSAASCTDGATLDTTKDKCGLNIGNACDSGFVLDVDKCYVNPTCVDPGAYSNEQNLCMTNGGAACADETFILDSATKICYHSAACGDGALDPVLDVCVAQTVKDCGDYSLDEANEVCYSDGVCNGGTFNPATNRCEKEISYYCPDGYTYNEAATRCEKAPVCVNGIYSADYNKCLESATFDCDTANGYTYNTIRSRCEKTPPACLAGTTYNTATDRCEGVNICNTGYTYNAATGECENIYDATATATYNQCTIVNHYDYANLVGLKTLTAAPGASTSFTISNGYYTMITTILFDNSCNVVGDRLEMDYDYYTLVSPGYNTGVFAYYNEMVPPCAPGGLYGSDPYCTTYQSDNKSVPITTYSCPLGGTLSGATCLLTEATNCTTGTYPDAASGKCVANPTCPVSTGWIASFDGNTDVCYTDHNNLCPSGMIYDSVIGKCVENPICAFGHLDEAIDKCVADASGDCGTYELDVAASICYQASLCDGAIFNPTLNRCEKVVNMDCGTYTLIPEEPACVSDFSCPIPNETLVYDYSTELDVCVTGANLQCPIGYAYNGFPVQACEAIPVCEHGTYTPTQDALPSPANNTLPHTQWDKCYIGDNICPLGDSYTCQSVPSKANINYCSPWACTDADGITLLGSVEGSLDAVNDGTFNENGECIGKIYIFNGKDYRCRSDDALLGLVGGGCCDEDKVFLGLVACKQSEIDLAALRKKDLCHYIGNYCSKELDLLVGSICIQHSDSYCCFHSVLARIIHEQGRPQIKRSWGVAKAPNCKGFSPEEFSKLDFSTMDFSEFEDSLNPNISPTKVEDLQNSATQNITGYTLSR